MEVQGFPTSKTVVVILTPNDARVLCSWLPNNTYWTKIKANIAEGIRIAEGRE